VRERREKREKEKRLRAIEKHTDGKRESTNDIYVITQQPMRIRRKRMHLSFGEKYPDWN
jgi:hypothetical protein